MIHDLLMACAIPDGAATACGVPEAIAKIQIAIEEAGDRLPFPELCSIVSSTLAHLPNPIDQVVSASQDPNPYVCCLAAISLSHIPNATARQRDRCERELFYIAQHNSHLDVRLIALVGLIQTGAPKYRDRVANLLERTFASLEPHERAVWAVNLVEARVHSDQLITPFVLDVLTKAVADNDRSSDLRKHAVAALGRIGRPAVVAAPLLLQIMQSNNHDLQLRFSCASALNSIAPGEERVASELLTFAGNYASLLPGNLGDLFVDSSTEPDQHARLDRKDTQDRQLMTHVEAKAEADAVENKINALRADLRGPVEALVNFLRTEVFLELDLKQKQAYSDRIRHLLIALDYRVECPECGEPAIPRVDTPGNSKRGITQLQHRGGRSTHTLKRKHLSRLLRVISPRTVRTTN